jgi:hypothetical protein
VELNLAEYNRAGEGWQANVAVKGDFAGEGVLYYQPCGGMGCPAEAQCEGDDGATVWLCQGIECIGYGLFEYNVSAHGVEAAEPYVEVSYRGDRHREAVVDYRYDETVTADGALRLPSEVTVFGTRLRFEVGSDKSFNVRTVRKRVVWGAIVLIVVAAAAVLYLGIGVIVRWVKDGQMTLPNAGFWDGVWLSLHAAVRAFCPCCSRAVHRGEPV